MDEIVYQTAVVNDLTVKVVADHDPENPREWDNLGVMCFKHGRYNLPWENDLTKGATYQRYSHAWQGWVDEDCYTWDDVLVSLKQSVQGFGDGNEIVAARKVYMLDHSGIRFSVGDSDPFGHLYMGWDSGCVGWIYTTRRQVKKIMGWSRITKARLEKIKEQLASEVNVYSQWSNGEVYGCVVTDADDDVIDGSWGFYSQEEALAEGKALAESTCGQKELA